MKLTSVSVRNFRSYVAGDGDAPQLKIGDGLNLMVGPNNCGKSNLLRALSLVLDPKAEFDPDVDIPSQMSWAYPSITARFSCSPGVSVEKTLLRYAREYETSAGARQTYAENNEVRVRVSYSKSGGRHLRLIVKGAGAVRGNAELSKKALKQLRKCVRFIYLRSGESLTSFLEGAFRELLHTVLKDHLRNHVAAADAHRKEYAKGLVEELLKPLQRHATDQLREVMTEVTSVAITPFVPSVSDTIGRAEIRITDAAESTIMNKGTGVRGALLVAVLSYLSKHSRRSLVLAVEEPESFLHPRAQQELRSDLAGLAKRTDVTLLVTTHSPFMLDRSPTTTLTAFRKSPDGRTTIGEPIKGNESRIAILSDLFGETMTPNALEAVESLKPGTRAILLVEGHTDGFYLEQALKVAGREELLEGIEIRQDGGAHKSAIHGILLKQMTGGTVPILALFDWDDVGKSARDLLKEKYKWQQLLTYREWLKQEPSEVPVEAEDMFAEDFLASFVAEAGMGAVAEMCRFKSGRFHYGFTETGKTWFMEYIVRNLKREHLGAWLDVIEVVRNKLKLSV